MTFLSLRRAGRPGPGELRVRRLVTADVPDAAAASAAAFGVDLVQPGARERWFGRLAHVHRSDPEGCFVAERDGRIVGVGEAMMREGLWVLSLLAVAPGRQSAGVGQGLMRACLEYGPPDAAGLIISSNDPRALRLYARAGFELRPTLQAEGIVDRRALPGEAARVTVEEDPDLEGLAGVSRDVRGAPHTLEIKYALARGARLLRDGERGFAVALAGQGPWLLIARDGDTARRLLWSALAFETREEAVRIRWIGGDQQWAVDLAVRAGLALSAYGAICVRGRVGSLSCYLPSAAFA